jgi:uncharacterized protein GlcG (DUF336 family)
MSTVVTEISTTEVRALLDTAMRTAEAIGVTISVSIVDRGGNLLGFLRDENALLISGETSTRKAYTAVQLDAATIDVVDAVKPDGPFHSLPTALDRPLLFIAGGVPLRRDGRLVGAIGVGGGEPTQDHNIATRSASEITSFTS